ncbi:MAG: succinyl-diaminopimelate desuccinylase [Pseudomonadota bacterium]
MDSTTLALAKALIRCPSVTPQDGGCQKLLGERLAACGFSLEPMPFGAVENLWARRGTKAPLLVFAGHTDVVPPGPRERWLSDPFEPVIREGVLYGRGAADMKGGLAAMVVAAEQFVASCPHHRGSIGFLLTSDEEGPAVEGTARVIKTLSLRGETIDWCLVGEPSSESHLGDTVKIGRRGSLNGRLTVLGKQGHVAYPDRALNAFHAVVPALTELCAEVWDQGDKHFPPTRFQISNLHAGTGAENVIPGEAEVWFNFRFSPVHTPEGLQQRVETILAHHQVPYRLVWTLSGVPFLTPGGELLAATRDAIRQVLGIETTPSTTGGTSDGRFIAPTGAQVLELGPLNASIHQVNEGVAVADLDCLTSVYVDLLRRLLDTQK